MVSQWNQFLWNSGAQWAPAGATPSPDTNPKRKSKPMKRQKYYPSQQSDEPAWLINFATQLIARGAEVGLTAAVINATVADSLYIAYAVGAWLNAVRGFGPDCTTALDVLKSGAGGSPYALPGFKPPPLPGASAPLPATVAVTPGALDRIFAIVQVIKMAAGYTDEIGQALGIVGSVAPPPPVITGPVPVAKVEPGAAGGDPQRVRITYIKHGHMGAAVYGRRGAAGSAMEMLGINTDGTFLDERALLTAGQPEVRQYQLRYWDKGVETGAWSDTITVTVGP